MTATRKVAKRHDPDAQPALVFVLVVLVGPIVLVGLVGVVVVGGVVLVLVLVVNGGVVGGGGVLVVGGGVLGGVLVIDGIVEFITRDRSRTQQRVPVEAAEQRVPVEAAVQRVPVEATDWSTASRVVGWSVRLLPVQERARYRDEFTAELSELCGQPGRRHVGYALRLLVYSVSLRRALQQEPVVPTREQDW